MKKKLIMGMLAVALAVGGVGAGASAGWLMPTMGQLFGATAAGAAPLNVEATAPLTPTGTGFTYQGRLKNGTAPANGQYDFQFTLYDALTGGTLVAAPVAQTNQTVSDGLFTVTLDFGVSAFNGEARYLAIEVRPTGGSYTTLSPRQPITPAPYALYALKTKGYKNVVTVSPDGGDFTSVQAALDSITDNSVTNKYLVWVKPGTYSGQVTMKQWVDIEGSGENTTSLTFSGSQSLNTGTVVGADNAELRSLAVVNTGGSTYAIAIYNDVASPSLLRVTAAATDGTNYNYGVYNTNDSSPTMNNVTIIAFGGPNYNIGVSNNSSSPTMNNVTVSGSGSGTASVNQGIFNNSSSPTMNNVTASGSGGSYAYGVFNFASSSPTMNNVTTWASGASNYTYGVNNSSSSPTMNNVTATASGGTPYAVYNSASSPTISNSTLSGGMDAIFSSGVGTVLVRNSHLTGNVWNQSSTVKIGGSYLNGFVGGPGGVTCAGNYDENYVFFPSVCP